MLEIFVSFILLWGWATALSAGNTRDFQGWMKLVIALILNHVFLYVVRTYVVLLH